jgi:hypothetical protein
MKIDSYQRFGGKHPETATIANVLANQGFVSPHSGRPFSEAMILGIAGGLGCGYILWEFEKYDAAILVMGFQNRWNYTVDFMQNLCDRLGVSAEFQETGGQKTAQKQLEAALEAGIAPIAWIDQESLPYFYLRPMYNGCFSHFVTAFGLEEGQVWVDDRARKPVLVEADDFAKARARIGSYKNRLLLLESNGGEVDVAAAVTAGIEDCIEHLGRDSQTFAIPVYQKWAKMMTDTKNKKGWPVVFKDGKGLYSTLRSIHEGIKLFGTDGGGLRTMYSNFLSEAAPILNNNALNDAAERYKALGQLWAAFADAVLPERIQPLGETRKLLAQKYAVYNEKGGEGLDEVGELSGQLTDLEIELNSNMPLSAAETKVLFAEMQEHLYGLYTAEKAALDTLKAAIE